MKLIKSHSLSVNDVAWGTLDPAYRRATKAMTLSALACENILQQHIPEVEKSEVALVVGTNFGEIQTTLDFLNGPIASPTLFQNSLHNAILGFVTVKLGMTGPAMTLSCDRDTESSSRQVAETLLQLSPYTLVCIVDSVPENLRESFINTYPFSASFLDKATCTLYARE